MPRLLRGGAAGIAGVLLTATPTWGAGLDAAHRNQYVSDEESRPAPETADHEARTAHTHTAHAGHAAHDAHEGPLRLLHGDQPWSADVLLDPATRAALDRAVDAAHPAAQEGPPGGWAHPVAASEMSAAYGIPGGWIAGHHTGVDFAVPVGTPVRSVGAGEVVQAGPAGDYGLTVVMRMKDGHYTLFAHLSKIVVKQGRQAGPNELLGYSGNTGRSSGPHLHFEVREGRGYGTDINPVTYLAGKGVHL